MAIKEPVVRQPTPQEQPIIENPTGNSTKENVRDNVGVAPLGDSKPVNPEVSSLIEVIEHLVREKKSEPSNLKKYLLYPLLIVFFSGLVGGGITHYYTLWQKEVDYQRSFSDELNKIRIQKIGEVWEQLDKNEVILESLLDEANKPSNSDEQNKQNVDAINSLLQEDKVIVSKNKFWLGKQYYNRIQEHLYKNTQIALNMLLAPEGTDLSELLEQREQLKQDILQIRESMRLEGGPSN